MTSSTSMRESRVRPAVLKHSFMLVERLAKDGEAGANKEHRSRAMDGYYDYLTTAHQASK